MQSEVSVVVSFLAGLVSFLSPCVLPLVPVYVTYLTGGVGTDEQADRHRLLINALGFIIGFSTIFVILGASATLIGRFLLINQVLFRKIAGIVIVLFGLQTLGVFRINFLQREWRPGLQRTAPRKSADWLRSAGLGLAFGFGWTPCVGPVLGSILVYASTAGTVAAGVWLLSWYSLGLALPFLVIALTMHSFGSYYLPWLQRHAIKIARLTGVLLIILGCLVYFNLFSRLSAFSF